MSVKRLSMKSGLHYRLRLHNRPILFGRLWFVSTAAFGSDGLFENHLTIGHVTDVEGAAAHLAASGRDSVCSRFACCATGNWDYWLEYLKVSKVLVTGKDGEIKLRDNCYFVFGGDTFGQPCSL